MQLHAKAALTLSQRRLVRQLSEQGVSQTDLARRFGVSRRTIQRWANRTEPTDRSSAPHQHGRRVVSEALRQAVLAERNDHPQHGPQRIADDLGSIFPSVNRTTVWRILKAAGLSQRQTKKTQAHPDRSRSPSGATRYSGTASD